MCVYIYVLSHVQLFTTPWTVAHQAPLSMGFSRKEYWSELPFPSPGDLPEPGIEARSPSSSCFGRWILYHSVQFSCSVVSDSLRPMDCSPPGFSVHGDFPGKNTILEWVAISFSRLKCKNSALFISTYIFIDPQR